MARAHLPTLTTSRAAQVIAAGSSPLHSQESIALPDPSDTARCGECRATFIAIGDRSAKVNLARHVEDKHAPRTRTDAVMLQRVVDTITGRIAGGSLTPGKTVNQGELAAELGVTRHYTNLAVEQLIETGTLRWSAAESTYARRAVVCKPD